MGMAGRRKRARLGRSDPVPGSAIRHARLFLPDARHLCGPPDPPPGRTYSFCLSRRASGWVGVEVRKPGFVPWKKGANIDDYVKAAGGYADRSWASRTRVFDLQSGLSLEAKSATIRPGAAVIVPEARYISPDQWLGIAASVASLALTMVILYVTVIK